MLINRGHAETSSNVKKCILMIILLAFVFWFTIIIFVFLGTYEYYTLIINLLQIYT